MVEANVSKVEQRYLRAYAGFVVPAFLAADRHVALLIDIREYSCCTANYDSSLNHPAALYFFHNPQ
jgi:hypothetical protein